MVVITRRARTILSPRQPESRELIDLRDRTRRALNKPFKFEPKVVTPPWRPYNSDPLVSLFKPFSPLVGVTEVPVAKDLRSQLRNFSWRRVLPVVAIGALLIAIFTIWQALTIIGRYPASLSQVAPKLTHTQAPSDGVSGGAVVPSGTKLDVNGPAPVGTTSRTTQPSSAGTSPESSGQTNLTARPSMVVTTAPAPTCPAGDTCSGTDVASQPCSISSPCRSVSLGPLGTVLIH